MASRFYNHWSEVDPADWRWKNFTPYEISSKYEGALLVDEEAMDAIQRLRDDLGKPVIVTPNGGYRSPKQNKLSGGAAKSQHLLGKAFDVSLQNQDREHLVERAIACGFTGIGYYRTFMHFDIGPKRRWDYR